jgi:hypothetical protein
VVRWGDFRCHARSRALAEGAPRRRRQAEAFAISPRDIRARGGVPGGSTSKRPNLRQLTLHRLRELAEPFTGGDEPQRQEVVGGSANSLSVISSRSGTGERLEGNIIQYFAASRSDGFFTVIAGGSCSGALSRHLLGYRSRTPKLHEFSLSSLDRCPARRGLPPACAGGRAGPTAAGMTNQARLTTPRAPGPRASGRGPLEQGNRPAALIEVATVKNHMHNLLEKLQVHHRRDAVALRRAAGTGTWW